MPEKVTTIDDTLQIYQERDISSIVIVQVRHGVELQLGIATVIDGREWIEATVDDTVGYVLGPSVRGHTTLGGKKTPPTTDHSKPLVQSPGSGGLPVGARIQNNTRDFNFYYTVIFMLVIGIGAIGVAAFNWSDFSTFGRTICSVVAGAALYMSALTLIEGFSPGLMGYACPRCGGPVGRCGSSGTDDIFAMVLLSLSNAFAAFQCAKCGIVPSNAFPLQLRIMAVLRSLRWLAFCALALGAISGIFFVFSVSHR